MREEQSDDESAQEAEEVGEERDQEKRHLSSDAEIIAVRTTSKISCGNYCCKNNFKYEEKKIFHQTRKLLLQEQLQI